MRLRSFPRRGHRLLVLAGGLTAAAFHVVLAARSPQPLAAVGDTYVVEDSGHWEIGSSEVSLVLTSTSGGSLSVESVGRPDGTAFRGAATVPDSSLSLQARTISPGGSALVLRQSSADAFGDGVRLRLVFEDTSTHLRITRSYAAFPASPAIEAWSTFEADPTQPAVPIADIGVWQFSAAAGEVSWVTGLSASTGQGGRFTRRQQPIAARLRLDIGATGRSSESAIPAISLDGPTGHLITGLLWSGAWGASVGEPDASGQATVRLTLGSIATTVRQGQPFETPHAFLGVSGPGELNLSAAWQAFVRNGVRHGRSIDPLVTHNTWFAHGTRIDDQTVRDEMDRASQVGVELFVVDAGWYPGGTSASDFSTGLGTWTVDTRRFPSGLGALRDYAHGLGLKFGVWVEPERVDTATVNRPGLAKERFLATTGGRYNAGVKNESASAAQICLGDSEARQWVFNELVGFLDTVRPDYLKWDNNYWINCDRAGHGHGDADGNLAHTQGLYGILAALRQRYPEMLVENCASGGRRLDLGMLQYTDAAWMDDVSGPSAHVRHNLEGLTAVFPPAYLESFVMDDPGEPIHQAADLQAIIRSRMPGVLGFSLRYEEFGATDLATMRREILAYRRARPILQDAMPALLLGQVDDAGSRVPDALEYVSSRTGDVAVYEFAGTGQAATTVSWPLVLDPEATYSFGLRSDRMQATGAALMAGGIAPSGTSASAARVVVLSRQP